MLSICNSSKQEMKYTYCIHVFKVNFPLSGFLPANAGLLSAVNAGMLSGMFSAASVGCFSWPMQCCFKRPMLAAFSGKCMVSLNGKCWLTFCGQFWQLSVANDWDLTCQFKETTGVLSRSRCQPWVCQLQCGVVWTCCPISVPAAFLIHF